MRIIRTLQVLIIAAMLLIPWKVEAGGPKTVWVRPYTKANGTSVSGHWRSPPDYGVSLSPLSPLISSTVGSTCYIPDYSMRADGSDERRSWASTTSKEGLDLSKCAMGTHGGAGKCEGFSITVAGRAPTGSLYNLKGLNEFCNPTDLTNLPGGASVVCTTFDSRGAGTNYAWTLTIIPEPICTDPETLPPAK